MMGTTQKYTLDPSVYLQHRARRGGEKVSNRMEWKEDISNQFSTLCENHAKGTSAKIDLVLHKPTNLVAAIKVFKPTRGSDADTELSIFNVVTGSHFLLHCLDAFNTKFHRCLVLEFAPFGSLDDLTRREKGLGSDTIKLYAKEMAQGLSFLHSHRIIHGDVKPENVLILASGHVVLADLNKAFQMTSAVPKTNQVGGTFLTKPPEMWDKTPYDQTVDVWMYGVSIYNIASNTWPFAHAFHDKQVAAVKAGKVTFPERFFSSDLADLITKAMQVKPSDRIPMDQVVGHNYFNSLEQFAHVPFSPSRLLSLMTLTQIEREILDDVIQQQQQEGRDGEEVSATSSRTRRGEGRSTSSVTSRL